MADELKRGYLRPRFVEGYDPAIDRMSDRIDELEAENERLRTAGDALAEALAWWGKGNDRGDAARVAWQEARRG